MSEPEIERRQPTLDDLLNLVRVSRLDDLLNLVRVGGVNGGTRAWLAGEDFRRQMEKLTAQAGASPADVQRLADSVLRLAADQTGKPDHRPTYRPERAP